MPDRLIDGHLSDHVTQLEDDPRGRGRSRRLTGPRVFVLYAIPIGIVIGLLTGGRLGLPSCGFDGYP